MDYAYHPLNEGHIRLFRAWPGDDGIIHGILSDFNFKEGNGGSRPPPYQALSYTWDTAVSSNYVDLDGTRLFILDSVHAFLKQTINNAYHAPWWWIDSICINQQDDREKASQIALMGSIFARADITCVWLGEETDDSTLAIKFLKWLGGDNFSYVQLYDRADLHDGNSKEWMAVNKLLKRPWWTRAWTVQEYVVSKEVWLKCGPTSISRDRFNMALDTVYDCGIHLRSSAQWNRARIIHWCEPFESDNGEHSLPSLVAMLAYLGDHHATDPRDRVYSLSGIVDDFNLAGIPDYRQSVEQLYTRIVKAFVETYQSLDIICLATAFYQDDEGGTPRTLPSWVPDWRREVQPLVVPMMVSQGAETIGNLRPLHKLKSTAVYRASGFLNAEVTFASDLQEISCTGFPISQIQGVAAAPCTDWGGSSLPVCALEQDETRSIKHSDAQHRDFLQGMDSIVRCLMLDREDHYLNHAVQGHDFLSQFRTLLAMARNRDSMLEVPFQDWYDSNQELWLGSHTLSTLITNLLKNTSTTPIQPLPDKKKRRTFQSRFHDTTVKMARRLVVLENGCFGTAPRRARRGDVICVLFGCNVPVVLRKCEDDDSFSLVGECYVDGYMSGEMLASPFTARAQTFRII